MRIRITVAYRGLPPSEASQADIVQHVRRLERSEADILRCHVYLERRDEQQACDHVDVQLTMRGGDRIASRHSQDESQADVHEAMRLAFGDVFEQLVTTRFRRYQSPRRERSAVSGW